MAWTHVADTFPVAKKRHRCVGCWEFIEIGEKYLSRFGFDDGPVTSRWHPECEEYAFFDGPDYDLTPGSFSRKEAKEWISTSSRGPRMKGALKDAEARLYIGASTRAWK